jgi:hypothetical protein
MQIEPRIEHLLAREEILPEKIQVRTKFNISMEKKIERLWRESEKQGWNFNQFVTATLEILTIIHHRNKLEPKKVTRRNRALS